MFGAGLVNRKKKICCSLSSWKSVSPVCLQQLLSALRPLLTGKKYQQFRQLNNSSHAWPLTLSYPPPPTLSLISWFWSWIINRYFTFQGPVKRKGQTRVKQNSSTHHKNLIHYSRHTWVLTAPIHFQNQSDSLISRYGSQWGGPMKSCILGVYEFLQQLIWQTNEIAYHRRIWIPPATDLADQCNCVS